MTRSSFYEFSKRIHSLADDIERVNETFLGSPVRRLLADGDKAVLDVGRNGLKRLQGAMRKAGEFRKLPARLRDYAKGLRSKSEVGGAKHRDLEADQEMILIGLVTSETGRPQFARVSDILEGTFRLSGSTRHRRIDEKSLADRAARYKRSNKAPVPIDDWSLAAENEFRNFLEEQRSRSPRRK